MMIIPGKIPFIKKAKLTVELSAGSMVDQQLWIPAAEHHKFFKNKYDAPYCNLSSKIILDNKVLLDTTLETSLKFYHNFLDSDDVVDHCFKIVVSGFDEKFCCFVEGIGEVSPMIKIDSFCIEDLNMTPTMEDSGQCFYDALPNTVSIPSVFIGQNGYQSLKFTTPIYPWLFENERHDRYYL